MGAVTLGRPLAAELAPMQPGLLGIEEAPAVPEVRLSIVGQVQRAAEVRIAPSGLRAHLFVTIVQPPHGGHSRLPIAAVLHSAELARYGPNAEVLGDMHALAKKLQPGSLALLCCRGIDHDQACHELRAWRCDRITAIPPAEAARFIPDHLLDNHEVQHHA